MKKKMMKAIKELNAYIDDDRQKLCDRCHDLELSYNRARRFINKIDGILKYYQDNYACESLRFELSTLRGQIHSFLCYPYLRVNYRMKGGKDA